MNYDEYLNLVSQVASSNLPSGSRYITAAALGALLHQASPDTSWKTFGKRTLSVVLEDMAQRNRLALTRTEKDALAVVPLAPPANDAKSTPVFNPLRKAVWDAFVLHMPVGRRFMNRVSGIVRSGINAPPIPADDWAEIEKIPTSQQETWAREFLEQHTDRAPSANSMPGISDWHPHEFYGALRAIDEGLGRQWNKFRSSRVSTVVQDWATKNQLSNQLVFETSTRASQPNTVDVALKVDSNLALHPDEVRRVILAAISTLPTEKLQEISIPAGVLLAAFTKARV